MGVTQVTGTTDQLAVLDATGLKVGQRVTNEENQGIDADTFITNIVYGVGNAATVTISNDLNDEWVDDTDITVQSHWEAYVYNGTSELAKLNLFFDADGTLNKALSHVVNADMLDLTAWDSTKGQLTFEIPYEYYLDEDETQIVVDSFELPLDFSAVTKYAGDFTATSTQTGGYPPGSLLGISVERDGMILARYGNGQQQIQAQVMLANFKNPNGLEVARDNQFLSTLASGDEQAGAPGQYGTGAIEGSSVEQSNVDLTGEMIKLIAAQRNYQAVAQLIKKQDEVLQTAINIGQ